MLEHRFQGKTAVVTGAGSGMGRAITLALAAEGCSVVAADRDRGRAEAVASEALAAGGHALAATCDVGLDADVDQLARAARDFAGDVDFLFNHAGVTALGPAEKIPVEDWQWVLNVNVMSVVRALRAFVPAMLQRGSGHVINTASVSGLYASGRLGVPYTTSKFAVMGLSQGLYLYLKPQGIQVSCFCPGEVATRFFRDGQARPTDYDLDAMLATFGGPAARTPEEAAAILLEGILAGRFLILTDESVREILAVRGQDLDAAMDIPFTNLVTMGSPSASAS